MPAPTRQHTPVPPGSGAGPIVHVPWRPAGPIHDTRTGLAPAPGLAIRGDSGSSRRGAGPMGTPGVPPPRRWSQINAEAPGYPLCTGPCRGNHPGIIQLTAVPPGTLHRGGATSQWSQRPRAHNVPWPGGPCACTHNAHACMRTMYMRIHMRTPRPRRTSRLLRTEAPPRPPTLCRASPGRHTRSRPAACSHPVDARA